MSSFGRGAAAAEQATRENKPAFGGGNRIELFKLEDDEIGYFRLVHDGDEWYYLKTHVYVPTKPVPEWWKKVQGEKDQGDRKKWPERMDASCRHDQAFEYGDCFICDHKHEYTPKKGKSGKAGKWWPTIRYYVPMVVREVVIGTQELIDAGEIPSEVTVKGEKIPSIGQRIGRQDKMIDVPVLDDDGNPTEKTEQKPQVVLCNLGYDNFFAQLQAIYEASGEENDDGGMTLLNRDIRVQRKGTGTETKYHIKEMKVDPELDLRDPEVRAQYDRIDVEKYMTERSTDEYYAKFFDETVEWEMPEDEEKSDSTSQGSRKTAPKTAQTKPKDVAPVVDDEDGEDDPDTAASLAQMKAKLTRTHGANKERASVGASTGGTGEDANGDPIE